MELRTCLNGGSIFQRPWPSGRKRQVVPREGRNEFVFARQQDPLGIVANEFVIVPARQQGE